MSKQSMSEQRWFRLPGEEWHRLWSYFPKEGYRYSRCDAFFEDAHDMEFRADDPPREDCCKKCLKQMAKEK